MKYVKSILLSMLFLVGCGESKDNYIGSYLYKSPFTGSEILAEIKKDGDSYIFIENLKYPSKVLPLSIEDDGLSYNGKLLKISEDQSKLYFAGITADRMSQSMLVEREEGQRKLRETCNKIQAEIDHETSLGRSTKDWNTYVRSVQNTAPEGCDLKGLNLKW
ncbi:TPA: hypothetical protein NG570_004543 [Vibrio parahaemolyticus]|uniref:hypothetical protein n=2 Tax=Vibrio parahaemolyticus TaxID=670 RepID=UPI00064AC7F0|nr:hypothetical protein [Vibrio parahaemolyticus]EGR1985716.1 hypothetical protein [Vibrio parahaemolyticus]EHJ9990359.1 hypothetical protein [Vibrio parahaemolyticus]EII3443204.1 hypothetical protein [Vibrio parahaemolyticus]EJA3100729.1 hypothetical protein [Vibrio parahaemolyticus]ELA7843105.1 hypothetical protein [Vibrio parahaemolyticus]